MRHSNRPQVILDIINTYDNKPIVKIDLFGRTILALIDSGAETSVINKEYLKDYDPTRGYVKTSVSSPVTGTSVGAYFTEVKLKLGGIQFFQNVCIAPMLDPDVFQMIIGYDLLIRQEAVIDARNSKIRLAIDTGTIRPPRDCAVSKCNYLSNDIKNIELNEILNLISVDQVKLNDEQNIKFIDLISTYQDILIEDVTKMVGADLEPYAPVFKSETPIFQRQYRIPHSLYNPLRKKLDRLEAAGIISRATSQWNSPVLAVRKPNGVDVRMVLDLRKINAIIEPLPYPLMRIEDIINRLGGSKVFSNLDLNNGYFNIKLADHVKERFAFSTPWGRFKMDRLPQGCITSASLFQQVMNNALHDLIGKGHVFVFQDDLIVHTATVDEHIQVLDELFAALKKLNMALRPTKCVFFKDTIKFLGHKISANGSKPSEENIMAIRKFERPRTVKQVRSFLGTINFYRKFIRDVTTLAAPLYALIKKDQTKIQWSEECNKSFILLKEALISAPVLAYPDFSQPFIIKADASDIAVGGVLEQNLDGELHPIAFCSRKLNRAERNYSVIEREALAIVYVLSQFRHLVYGYPIILHTDHKPLSYIFQLKDSNQRLVRWLLHIQDYNLMIKHIKGELNCVADMLSRADVDPEPVKVNAVNTKHEAITNERIKLAQKADPNCLAIIENVNKDFYTNKEYILDEHGLLLKLIVPTRAHSWRYRIVLPLSLRVEVMFHYHDRIYSGHLSAPKVIWKIKLIFTWDTMFRDITDYIRSCEVCQKRNTSRIKAPFQPITSPSYPLERLNVDLLGPFTVSKNKNRYLILYTDSLTRFVIGSAIPNIEASTIAADYINNVFSVHGGSREILSDKGSQFTSSIFQNICKRLNIKHLTTSSYRPSCNGLAERTNQRVLRILAQTCNKYYNDWDEKLPYVLHAIRTSHNRSSGETSFFLFHGFDAIDPVIEPSHTYREKHSNIPEFVERTFQHIEESRAIVAENLTVASAQNCKARNDGRKLREFYVGEQVLYLNMASYAGKNRKMLPRYKGPYRVIARLGLVNYRIRNISDNREVKTTHVDKIKHYYPRMVLDDVAENSAHHERSDSNMADRDIEDNLYQDRERDEYFYIPVPGNRGEDQGPIQNNNDDNHEDPEIIEVVGGLINDIQIDDSDIIHLDTPVSIGPTSPTFGPPSSPVVLNGPHEFLIPHSPVAAPDQIEIAVPLEIPPPVAVVAFPSTSTDLSNPSSSDSDSRERKNSYYNLRDRTVKPKHLKDYKLYNFVSSF